MKIISLKLCNLKFTIGLSTWLLRDIGYLKIAPNL